MESCELTASQSCYSEIAVCVAQSWSVEGKNMEDGAEQEARMEVRPEGQQQDTSEDPGSRCGLLRLDQEAVEEQAGKKGKEMWAKLDESVPGQGDEDGRSEGGERDGTGGSFQDRKTKRSDAEDHEDMEDTKPAKACHSLEAM